MTKVFAITGKIGSGKNYVMEKILLPYLKSQSYSVSILAFADYLKVKCCIENDISYDRVFVTKDVESRLLLQSCGDQLRKINPDALICALDNYIRLTFDRGCDIVLISDVRYRNEYEWLKSKHNACIIRVVAPHRTHIKVMQEAYNCPEAYDCPDAYTKIINHISETQLDDVDITTIHNDFGSECTESDLLPHILI